MNKETILSILLVIILLGTGFIGGFFYRNEECKSCQMYDTSFGVDGLYFPSESYYCVWTEGRTESQIQKTEVHEQCHALIDKDYYHFCEEYQ